MKFRTALRVGTVVVGSWLIMRRGRKAAQKAIRRGARRIRAAVA